MGCIALKYAAMGTLVTPPTATMRVDVHHMVVEGESDYYLPFCGLGFCDPPKSARTARGRSTARPKIGQI